jgi:hypothetical protein
VREIPGDYWDAEDDGDDDDAVNPPGASGRSVGYQPVMQTTNFGALLQVTPTVLLFRPQHLVAAVPSGGGT